MPLRFLACATGWDGVAFAETGLRFEFGGPWRQRRRLGQCVAIGRWGLSGSLALPTDEETNARGMKWLRQHSAVSPDSKC